MIDISNILRYHRGNAITKATQLKRAAIDVDWWIFSWSFLLLEAPIEQSMVGFLGWVMKMVADFLDWIVGVWSSVMDECGSPPQILGFATVLMQLLLVCVGSGGFSLHLAKKYWTSHCSCWWRGYSVAAFRLFSALGIICA